MIEEIAEIQEPQVNNNAKDICISINFDGSFSGQYIFSLNKHMAGQIAGNMMGGLAADELDEEDIISAVTELCNIAAGNASILLEKENIHINIEPPKVTQFSEIGKNAIYASLKISAGTFNIGIG